MGFNERLKEARLSAGLTGERLGAAIGCSKQNISHWESGRFEPNLGFLMKLCQVLDVPADWLLLGKVPEDLSAGALREARFYDSLSPEGKRKWEMAKMLFREGVSDLEVEDRMQETKRFKSEPKAEKTPLPPAGRGMSGGVQIIGNISPKKGASDAKSDRNSRVPVKKHPDDT